MVFLKLVEYSNAIPAKLAIASPTGILDPLCKPDMARESSDLLNDPCAVSCHAGPASVDTFLSADETSLGP